MSGVGTSSSCQNPCKRTHLYQARTWGGVSIELLPPLHRSDDRTHDERRAAAQGEDAERPLGRVVERSAHELDDPVPRGDADGGRHGVGDQEQDLVRWRKKDGAISKETLGAVRFVPMVPGSAR